MTLLSDEYIEKLANKGMIEPFERNQIKQSSTKKIVSYGLSSYGYDLRVADEFKVFTNVYSSIIDPKNFSED
nr:Deoxycytidine triphosphate deaminase [Candidatus Anoxychlamydiales bacterium]